MLLFYATAPARTSCLINYILHTFWRVLNRKGLSKDIAVSVTKLCILHFKIGLEVVISNY